MATVEERFATATAYVRRAIRTVEDHGVVYAVDPVIRVPREGLRIIDQQLWEAAQERLRAMKDKYTLNEDGTPKGRGRPFGTGTRYPLSGLLFCGACDSPMIIGGTSGPHRYYVCPSSRRGRCSVHANVRAQVVEERILGALADRLLNGGAAQIRKQLALRMDELTRNHQAEVKDRRARLDRAQKRVANLVEAMASGERSAALSNALKEAEAEVEVERGAIADIERLATQPVRLLTVDEVARKVQQIGVLVKSDPISAREELRRCFHRGKIGLHLNAKGAFVARTELLGEILLVETRTPVQGVNLGRARTGLGSGGAKPEYPETRIQLKGFIRRYQGHRLH